MRKLEILLVALEFLLPTQGQTSNVALNKPAYLSSLYLDNYSKYGVDGNKWNYAHAENNDEWFVVDLLKKYQVERVVVYNRDCNFECARRLDYFVVGLADEFDRNNAPPKRGAYRLCGKYSGTALGVNNPMEIKCNEKNAKARYVILQNSDEKKNRHLNFNELEVYSEEAEMNGFYMGCYGKHGENSTTTKSVTSVEKCISFCSKERSPFALIKASECLCSSKLGRNSPSSACSHRCSQDKNPCGSTHLYSAYQTKSSEKVIFKELGCFVDEAERDFPFKSDYGGSLTRELCQRRCLNEGFKYSAVQAGFECFCGHTYGRYGRGSSCDSRCTGNKSQTCGGTLRNEVFEACYTYEDLLDTCSLRHCLEELPTEGSCGSCAQGWQGYACSQRNCSEANGACGNNKCEHLKAGAIDVTECVCNEGYTKRTYHDDCLDVNECEEETDKCPSEISECVNTEGSYFCNCWAPAYVNKDNHTCIAIANIKKAGIIGGVVASVFLIFLFVVILFCLKRGKLKSYVKRKVSLKNVIVGPSTAESSENVEKFHPRVHLRDLKQFYITQKKQISQQFDICPKIFTFSREVGSSKEVALKNRFKTIFPYDHNRVLLQADNGEPSSDYINASFVSAYETVKEYSFIAAQGPKEQTLEDFWRMVMQYSVPVVVMLTKCFEEGSSKCCQYWPDSNSSKYGSFLVTLVAKEKSPNVEHRILRVEDKKNGKVHTTHHLLYTAWPDKSVPRDVMSLLKLRNLMHLLFKKSQNGTDGVISQSDKEITNDIYENIKQFIVVHCSAGVGRTGTFICLDHLIHEALHTGSIDVFAAMKRLREERCLMIQTKTQYEMCYQLMWVYHAIGEDTAVKFEDKRELDEKMFAMKNKQDEMTLMWRQFEIIDEITKNTKLQDLNRANVELSYGHLDAVYCTSAEEPFRYVMGLIPSEFNEKDILTLLHKNADFLILMETDYRSESLLRCMRDCADYKGLSFLDEADSERGRIMEFRVDDLSPTSEHYYSNAETTNNNGRSQFRKVIQAPTLHHDVVQFVYNLFKKDESAVVMVLSRYAYDKSSVMVAALKMADSIETYRKFDVYQTAFELRLSQPTCLHLFELYVKLYSIAENLARKKLGKVDGDEDAYDKVLLEPASSIVIPSLRKTLMFKSIDDAAYVNDAVQATNIEQPGGDQLYYNAQSEVVADNDAAYEELRERRDDHPYIRP